MKVMIFAAGFGKRLLPLTKNTPKPLISLQNKPVLDWVIQTLLFHRMNELIINTHYQAQQIKDYFKNRNFSFPVHILYEKTILGTGGGLINACEYLKDQDFLLYNSDILTNANLTHMLEVHKKSDALVTLAVQKRKGNSLLLINENKQLCGLQKNGINQIYCKQKTNLISVGFCGIHVLSPKFFENAKNKSKFSIIDMYLDCIQNKQIIQTWDIENSNWADIGSFEVLEEVNQNPFTYIPS